MREGSIEDATIVAATPSNKVKQPDPAMKQANKGNPWYFGLKAHMGVDAVTGLTHSLIVTSANEANVTVAKHMLRDDCLWKNVYMLMRVTPVWASILVKLTTKRLIFG